MNEKQLQELGKEALESRREQMVDYENLKYQRHDCQEHGHSYRDLIRYPDGTQRLQCRSCGELKPSEE